MSTDIKDNNYKGQLIGQRIKTLREGKNMSCKTLSQKTGIEPSMITKIENGEHFVSIFTLKKISRVLETHFEDLLPQEHIDAFEKIINYSQFEKHQLQSLLTNKIKSLDNKKFSHKLEQALKKVETI